MKLDMLAIKLIEQIVVMDITSLIQVKVSVIHVMRDTNAHTL